MSAQSHLRDLATELLAACKQGSLPAVRSTASRLYQSPSFSTSSAIPPLKIILATAAQHGHAAVLHYLITALPACSRAPSPWNPPPLFPDTLPEQWKEAQYSDLVVLRAVQSSSPGVVQTLLDAGMMIDHQMDKIGPPLGVAITSQSIEMVKFLLNKGANANNVGWIPPVTFLARAAALPSRDILIALLEHGAEIPGSGALFAASEAGNVGAAEVLLEKGADVNEVTKVDLWGDARDVLGTALHAATKHEQGEMVKFLLKRGARKDSVDGDSNTPRNVAERGGKADIIRILDETE
ncbi:hypothetical protein QQS21_006452 [Conoideocrella luteorostrata]|uniref:Ankyrin n=1 Tax=Conoideocrella luteorostrata TaxID=1105319 RepID=A0AAJ0CQH2_9HYPO|nr:hypothetical protein QQS21_006452 [Conoideocrella luteorostrata]